MSHRLPPARRLVSGTALTVFVALLLPACSHFKSDTADADGASKPPSGTDTADAASSESPADGVDALAAEARRFAERREAEASEMGRDGEAAHANAVRWLNDPERVTPPHGPGSTVSVRSTAAPESETTGTEGAEAEADPGRDPAASSPTEATAAEPQAPPAPEPMTRERMLAELADGMDVEHARSLRPWLARAALSVIDPAHELTAAELDQLSPEHRRTVTAYQRTFAQLGRTLGDGNAADARALRRAASELADQLDEQQPLTIRNLKLCKRVKGFGVYQTFERNVFLARREHPVIVYAELDHFGHRTESDGRHAVELTQEIVLYNESDGLPVWRQKPTRIIDRSYNIREDFFVVQVVRLSPRLTVGKYRLKVTITDEVGQTIDEASMPIRIVADAQADGTGDD